VPYPFPGKSAYTYQSESDHRFVIGDSERVGCPSRTWRELIKKIWNTDPLLCPKCGGEMRLISLIEDRQVIEDILRHLSLWEEKDGPSGLAPPEPPFRLELTYAPVDDDQFYPDESFAE